MHVQHPVAARRERGVVGHEHERGAVLAMAAKQKLDDLAARSPRRDCRSARRRRRWPGWARARAPARRAAARRRRAAPDNATAGRRGRPRSARARRARTHRRAPASSSGTATFSSAVMVGMRWKAWKTMPICLPRKRASSSSSSLPRSSPATTTEPASGPFQSGHHHQQRRLAGSRRAKECDSFAAPYIEADVSEDMNAGGAAAERQVDPAQRNGGAAERMPQRVMHVSG